MEWFFQEKYHESNEMIYTKYEIVIFNISESYLFFFIYDDVDKFDFSC